MGVKEDTEKAFELLADMFKMAKEQYKPYTYVSRSTPVFDIAKSKFHEVMREFCDKQEKFFRGITNK